MTTDARSRMLDGTIRLLARKGMGASFSELIEASGAPRGSIYHHFPGGKEQLLAEAIALASSRQLAALELLRGQDAFQIVAAFFDGWRRLLLGTEFGAGCSVAAVTVAAGSGELISGAGAVFRDWGAKLAELLEAGGIPASAARGIATLMIAGSEGAVVLCRAQHSIVPLDSVEASVLDAVRTA
ncbi:TetR/AcrR family transcriptional regulator [Gryllotalpicola koreensis]|uniref:TetR/AcrR family transcriptional regulator n=1 Tax=Gryllotalpicola koreensis TaxID=993086 RepID=A0ABP7ZT86_9MICO